MKVSTFGGALQQAVAFGGKADMSGFGLLLRQMTPEPHFGGRKSLV